MEKFVVRYSIIFAAQVQVQTPIPTSTYGVMALPISFATSATQATAIVRSFAGRVAFCKNH